MAPNHQDVPTKASLRTRLMLALAGTFAVVLLLFALEVILRLAGIGNASDSPDPFVGFKSSATLFEAQDRFYKTRSAKLRFFNKQVFPREKAPNTCRIFTLGGSTTYGRPYDHQVSFSRWLSELLPETDASKQYEVINAGGISYASYRVARLVEELVNYQPDLLVIYSGHNEFLEERTYGDLKHQDDLLQQSRGLLARTNLYRAIYKARFGGNSNASKTQLGEEVATRLDSWNGMQQYHRDEELARSIRTHYENNLRRILRMARARGIQVVFVTPASNLADFSPFKSQHGVGFDPLKEPVYRNDLGAAQTMQAKGQHDQAREALEKLVKWDPQYAESWYRLGQSLRELGQEEKAREALERAYREDVCPLRAPPEIIATMKEVATQEQVPLVDLVQILSQKSILETGFPLPGDRYFLDHVHLDVAIHQLVAEKIIEKMLANGRLEGQLPAQRETIYAAALAKLPPSYYAKRDLNLAKVLGWAGKTEEASRAIARAREVLTDDPLVQFNGAMLDEKKGDDGAALTGYQAAIRLDPRMMEAHLNMGRVLHRMGRHREALTSLEKAADLSPDNDDILYTLALVQLALKQRTLAEKAIEALAHHQPDHAGLWGLRARAKDLAEDHQGALEAYRKQVETTPESAGAHYDLGLAYARADQYQLALDSWQESLRLEPQSGYVYHAIAKLQRRLQHPEAEASAWENALNLDERDELALSGLADLARDRGDFEEAAQWYRKTLAINPEDGHAINNLGAVLGQLGHWQEAADTLEKGLKLEPDSGRLHYNLAQMLMMAGKPQQGATHLRRAKKLGIVPAPEIEKRLAPYQ